MSSQPNNFPVSYRQKIKAMFFIEIQALQKVVGIFFILWIIVEVLKIGWLLCYLVTSVLLFTFISIFFFIQGELSQYRLWSQKSSVIDTIVAKETFWLWY